MLCTNKDHAIQIQDFCDSQFSASSVSVQPCRNLKLSILNKSSINSISLSDSMLAQIPILPQNLQKLDLSRNRITQFPLNLPNLKQLILDNNLLNKLPQQINDMQFLRILRANSNSICILPLLTNLRTLELNNNPIKLITTKLAQSKLHYLQFDWIAFLVNVLLAGNEQQVFYQLCDIIDDVNKKYAQKQKYKPERQRQQLGLFVTFQQLFKHRKQNNGLQLNYLLHKAIKNNSVFFVQFLQQFYHDQNYNIMKYNQKYVLEEAFEQKNNSPKILDLFKVRKSNISEPQTYIINLALACQYNNIDFFNYLIGHGLKRHIIQQNQFQLLQIIFKNFDKNCQSDVILTKILQLSGFDKDNKKIFHLPRNYSIPQADCICEGVVFVMEDKMLSQIIDFQSAIQDDILEPLLHFAMMVRKPQLVKLILERFNKPFVKNYAGKMAKSIRGSLFSRKLVWKYEKKNIKKQLQSQIETQKQSEKKRVSSQRWFNIVYNKKTNTLFQSPILKQRYPETILMGPRIQSAQKQMQHRSMLNKMYFSPSNSQNSILGEQILDQTGILYDYSINAENTSHLLKKTKSQIKIHQKMNSLSIYQAYQKSQIQNIIKDYDVVIKVTAAQSNGRNYVLPVWNICSNLQQTQNQKQTVVQLTDKTTSLDMCRDPCFHVSDNADIQI